MATIMWLLSHKLPSGNVLLKISYDVSKTSEHLADNGDGGKNRFAITRQVRVGLEITFDSTAMTVTVTQNTSMHLDVVFYYGHRSAIIARRNSTTLYKLAANSGGDMVVTPLTDKATLDEHGPEREEESAITDLPMNKVMDAIQGKTQKVMTPTLRNNIDLLPEVDLSGRKKCFPTTNVMFAASGDLVAHQRYQTTT